VTAKPADLRIESARSGISLRGHLSNQCASNNRCGTLIRSFEFADFFADVMSDSPRRCGGFEKAPAELPRLFKHCAQLLIVISHAIIVFVG
jgi:hypothetical protein